MGNSHNNTNLRKNCSSFNGDARSTEVFFGDYLVVYMDCRKRDDNTEHWNVEYKTGKELKHNVYIDMKTKHDDNGVESIIIDLSDDVDDDKNYVTVDISCVGSDGLHVKIKDANIRSCSAFYTIKNDKQDYSIETTIISYDCSHRNGLFILQMKKMNEVAYIAAIAHYYVTKTIGLYVEATICRSKDKGFVIEVNGPFKYQSVYLRRVIDETRRTGDWSPGGKPSTKNEYSNSSLNGDNIVVGQIVKRASNKGLINSNGYTNGSLNNSVFCTIM